ncbi:hypothetical protein L228DRAFT_238599 [Xylona heveae TC161]|uniref:Uncharacterized protein n=1 Tax=Xylona heveae (strain CBS 132557 / TC161) TaxID=1328760 RepID=A0A165GWC2_XYLHT|nr:hypothetical protein L228DRAFT_238599 [Xylona heveae TC161]KZF22679.1 hypothetical protein L228DRAFT_238599 [Xylona heveae TC161]
MYISLPPPSLQKAASSRFDRRRYPLTPSTITPPSLTAHTSSASRQGQSTNDQYGASALLARVASSPPSPQSTLNCPPFSSASNSNLPITKLDEHKRQEAFANTLTPFQDGYTSFPDFDRFGSPRPS